MCLPTMTHARLRADQGDLAGARRVLRDILESDPRNDEARELLTRLGSRRARPAADDRPDLPPPPRSAAAGELAAAFRRELSADESAPSTAAETDDTAETTNSARRVERLESWLERIRSGSTAGH
jgi:hypothetical protein